VSSGFCSGVGLGFHLCAPLGYLLWGEGFVVLVPPIYPGTVSERSGSDRLVGSIFFEVPLLGRQRFLIYYLPLPKADYLLVYLLKRYADLDVSVPLLPRELSVGLIYFVAKDVNLSLQSANLATQSVLFGVTVRRVVWLAQLQIRR